eukprot:Platyproteum_vivax@DN2315_c0_g1_i1.p1
MKSVAVSNEPLPHNELVTLIEQEKIIQNNKTEYREEYSGVKRVYKQEKLVVVPKVIAQQEFVYEVPQVVSAQRVVYKPKIQIVEKIIEVPKTVIKEKIIEVPQIREIEKVVTRRVEVPVVQVIKVPKYVEVPEIEYVNVPVPRVVEVPQEPEIIEKEQLHEVEGKEVIVEKVKYVEKSKVVPRYFPVEKIVEVPIDTPMIMSGGKEIPDPEWIKIVSEMVDVYKKSKQDQLPKEAEAVTDFASRPKQGQNEGTDEREQEDKNVGMRNMQKQQNVEELDNRGDNHRRMAYEDEKRMAEEHHITTIRNSHEHEDQMKKLHTDLENKYQRKAKKMQEDEEIKLAALEAQIRTLEDQQSTYEHHVVKNLTDRRRVEDEFMLKSAKEDERRQYKENIKMWQEQELKQHSDLSVFDIVSVDEGAGSVNLNPTVMETIPLAFYPQKNDTQKQPKSVPSLLSKSDPKMPKVPRAMLPKSQLMQKSPSDAFQKQDSIFSKVTQPAPKAKQDFLPKKMGPYPFVRSASQGGSAFSPFNTMPNPLQPFPSPPPQVLMSNPKIPPIRPGRPPMIPQQSLVFSSPKIRPLQPAGIGSNPN